MGLENPRIEDGLTIDLAQELDFRLGHLSVSPSSREISRGGVAETLEPRIMQVLVALTRACGSVVSRDELIQSCWEGRVVGEDSINRAIWRLRKVAEHDDPAPFTIETIPRIGYRLKADTALPPTSKPPAPAMPKAFHFGWWRPAIVSLATTMVALGVWSLWPIHNNGNPSPIPILTERGEPAFAPDGTMLAAVSGPATRQVQVNAPSGTRMAQAPGEDGISPSWSPDGKWLAYVAKQPDGTCRIMVVALKQRKARQAAPCKAAEASTFAWGSPYLYFTDQVDASGNAIFRIDLRTGARQRMTGAKQAIDGWP